MVYGLSNIGRASRAGSEVGERVEGRRGDFRGQAVEAGASRPKAADVLRTALLDVQHALKSIFGMRVSTSRPAQVSTPEDAARGVLHAMTKRNVDSLDVAESLSALMRHGQFPRDASRDGITQGASALFGPALRDLSDLQLKRLHSNMGRRPELLEGLAQRGSTAVMSIEEPTVEELRGGGAVDDLGFGTMALRDCLMDELKDRGLALGEPRADADASDRGIELLARHAVANGGDLAGALSAARQDLADERAALAQTRADGLLDALGELGLRTDNPALIDAGTPAVAAPPPDNSAVNASFSRERISWIIDEKLSCIAPENAEKQHMDPVAVGGSGDHEVAWLFRRDLKGDPHISFEGVRLDMPEEGDVEARAERFCADLSAGGLSREDVLLVSRMINQNTFAVVMSQYMLDPANAPGIKLPDGDVIPVAPAFKDLRWSVTTTDEGVEVGVTAAADLDGATMASMGSKFVTFDAGSSASIAMTFVLQRNEAGTLALTDMRDSRMDVRAASEGRVLV